MTQQGDKATRAVAASDPKDAEIARLRASLEREIETRQRSEQVRPAADLNALAVINGIPGLVGILAPDGNVEIVNRQILEYCGATLEELQKWSLIGVVHPDDHERNIELFSGAITAGLPYDHEIRLRRHDGVFRWFTNRGVPVKDADGKILRWYVLLIDIDDRKRAEDKLRRSEAILAQGEDLSETGSFSWTVAMDEIEGSEQLYRICGFEPGSHLSLARIGERLHPLDRALSAKLTTQARAGLNVEYEPRLLMPDGSVRYLRYVARRLHDPEGRIVELMGTIQDITSRKLAEQEHDRVRSELTHAARAMSLGVLTASLAHEVNQPLAGITTNANTCVRMLSSEPPNLKGALETARRTIRDANRASDVVSRMRKLFSKKEFAAETVDLTDAAREVLALTAHELQRYQIVVVTEFAKEPVAVTGDRVQIQQVILNLLLNASDAVKSLDDGPRTIAVETGADGHNCGKLAVRDNGVGISPEALGKLFTAFYTTKPHGMGIGLSVSRSIIDRHHGQLQAAANDGAGATFSFTIPIAG